MPDMLRSMPSIDCDGSQWSAGGVGKGDAPLRKHCMSSPLFEARMFLRVPW